MTTRNSCQPSHVNVIEVNGCLKIVDNSKVATAKQKPAVEDDKQLLRNFIT